MSMTLAEMLYAASINEICEGAGVSQPTVTRYRQAGKVSDTPTGRKVVDYLEGRFANGDAGGKRGPGAEHDPTGITGSKSAMQLANEKEKHRKAKRENDIAEGKLVSADDVQARIATAANEFRSGTETLRRDVLAGIDNHGERQAVAAALDAGLERLRERVSGALGG